MNEITVRVGAADIAVGDLIVFALDNSQSGSLEGLKAKRAIKEKLKSSALEFSTDEILLIKQSALQTLKDGATIALLEAIAPNDLK